MQTTKFIDLGRAVVDNEAEAIIALSKRIDDEFSKACELLLNLNGRAVVIGMGKSGHIASKISATLASTGTPSFFVHPGEAQHGDMGMITSKDIVIAISNSGETSEIITLLPLLKRLNVPLIAITGNKNSSLAKNANHHLDISIKKEACPLGLAPTTSTTCALVMGDALAIALLTERGFTEQDFALSHPGGTLGRKLLLKVEDIMHTKDALPIVYENTLVSEALIEITTKKLGMAAVINTDKKLKGIFTDGDLRRVVLNKKTFHKTYMNEVMNTKYKWVDKNILAAKALTIMQENKINGLLVLDNGTLVGAFNTQDILKAGII